MSHYIVSARKYRPNSFSSVVGQNALTTTLQNSINTGKLAHAYLFCGPRGVGKTTCARIFAKNINCLSPNENGESCGTCESCVAFNEQRSYNIHELDAASNNSVDDIRQLIEQVRIQPQVGKYKVFIIDEVHMLSSAAFNAFLKTLEEPPAHAIFILATTEKHKILPTILSRCQIYDFNRMEIADIVEHLKKLAENEGYTYEEEAINIIAQKADGGMRDALSIFDQISSFTQGNITYKKVLEHLNVLDYDYYFKLTDQLLNKRITEALLTLNEILSKGFESNHFIKGLAMHFRELLVSKDQQTLPLLEVSENIKIRYQQQSQQCPLPFLYKALKICNNCDINYKSSSNKRLLVEITLIEIAQCLEDDSNGCGRSPIKILKPIFNKTEASSPKQQGGAKNQQHSQAEQTNNLSKLTNSNFQQKASSARSIKIPKTISIKLQQEAEVASNHQGTEKPQTTENVQLGENPFDESDVNYAWYKYAVSLPKEMSAIAGRMKNQTPKLISEYHVEVGIEHPQVLEYMLSLQDKILHFLRTQLNNHKITLEFVLSKPKENSNKLLSPRERFSIMLQNNAAFLQLKEQLNLELN